MENKKREIAKFYEQIFLDAKLKERLEEKLKEIANEEDFRKLIREEIMPLMKKFKVNFSEEELLTYEEETLKKLSKEDFANVSGGAAFKPLAIGALSALALTFGVGVTSFATKDPPTGKTPNQGQQQKNKTKPTKDFKPKKVKFELEEKHKQSDDDDDDDVPQVPQISVDKLLNCTNRELKGFDSLTLWRFVEENPVPKLVKDPDTAQKVCDKIQRYLNFTNKKYFNLKKYCQDINIELEKLTQSNNDDEVMSGKCGENVNYKITGPKDNLTLNIFGKGDMYDYDEKNPAPWQLEKIANVVIKYGVTSIGENAFCNPEDNRGKISINHLKQISIPSSVTSIGDFAFYGCNSLTSIDVPGSVLSIGMGAFAKCEKLTSANISEGITSIGMGAFEHCESLTFVIIPKTVISIGNYAFHNCQKLTSINIPEGVTSIGDGTFSWCQNLESVYLPKSITSIGDGVFCNCWNLVNIEIPPEVTSIRDSAFYSCKIKSIIIPKSVYRIGREAFSECSELESVIFLGDNEPNYDQDGGPEHAVFKNCKNLKNIKVQDTYAKTNFCGKPVMKTVNYDSFKTSSLPEQAEHVLKTLYKISDINDISEGNREDFIKDLIHVGRQINFDKKTNAFELKGKFFSYYFDQKDLEKIHETYLKYGENK